MVIIMIIIDIDHQLLSLWLSLCQIYIESINFRWT